jgi:hypothetical protein
VCSRVQCLFGPAAQVTVRRRESGGTVAQITIPTPRAVPISLAAS